MSYVGITGSQTGKIFDKELELVAADSSVPTSGTSPVFIGNGLLDADLVLNFRSPTSSAATVVVQFAADAAFTTPVAGPSVTIPANKAGIVIIPFRNDPSGAPLGYIRLLPSATVIMGAFITKR